MAKSSKYIIILENKKRKQQEAKLAQKAKELKVHAQYAFVKEIAKNFQLEEFCANFRKLKNQPQAVQLVNKDAVTSIAKIIAKGKNFEEQIKGAGKLSLSIKYKVEEMLADKEESLSKKIIPSEPKKTKNSSIIEIARIIAAGRFLEEITKLSKTGSLSLSVQTKVEEILEKARKSAIKGKKRVYIPSNTKKTSSFIAILK
jgi:hypothetical protein